MAETFFQRKKISKCDRCRLNKYVETRIKNPLVSKYGTGEDVLILLDMVEYDSSYEKFEKFLRNNNIDNYTIFHTLLCRTKDFKISSPAHKHFSHCDCIDIDQQKYKVIITVGRALYAVTQSDDIISWNEFSESNFNQTYFYYKGKRVYPIASISEWLGKDCFNNYFIKEIQLPALKQHLTNYKEERFDRYTITRVEDPNKFLEDHMNEKLVSWDTETNSLDCFIDDFQIGCLTMTFDGINGYYLPFDKIDKNLLKTFFKGKYSITANGKYDLKTLAVLNILDISINEDVILLFHILNTDRLKNSIKSLAWLINMGGYDKELDEYVAKYRIDNYLNIPEKIMLKYSVLDAIVTFRLYKLGLQLAEKQPEVYKVYKECIIKVIPAFLSMELNGMLVDTHYMNAFNDSLQQKENILKAEIKKYTGDILISSPEKLGRSLEMLGLPCITRTEKGVYNTGEPVLVKMKKISDHPVLDLILQYKEVAKLRGTFVGKLPEEKNNKDKTFFTTKTDVDEDEDEGLVQFIQSDNRIHPTFNPARAASGRSSCITDDSLILLENGIEIELKNLINNYRNYKVITKEGVSSIKNVFYKGEKEVFELQTENNHKLRLTSDHLVFTDKGWKKVKDLDLKDDELLIYV